MEVIHKIGRRKTSVARVYMSKGKGNIIVNKKAYSDFFSTATLQYKVLQPFNLTETKDKFDLSVSVKGGGINGQAEAIRLAISRALVEFNEEFKFLNSSKLIVLTLSFPQTSRESINFLLISDFSGKISITSPVSISIISPTI